MNMRKCWVETCQSSANREQDRGVTYHKLPKSGLSRQKWLMQARLGKDADNKWCFICSRHFRKVDFELYKASKFVLKPDAIPTIFTWGVTPLEELDKKFVSLQPTEDCEVEGSSTMADKLDESNVNENIPVTIENAKTKDASPETKESIVIKTVSNPDQQIKLVPADMEEPPDDKDSQSVIDETKQILSESNSTLPEIESIFENLFEEQKYNSASTTFSIKTSSDDDKPDSCSQAESTETADSSTSISTPKSDVTPNTKLPVGRPRRRSPNNHKSAITTKKKIERRKRIANSNLNMEEKTSSMSVKFQNGVLMQGSRVEAKDFNDHWYPARVVEVDHDDMEVFIHYDNWSQRFDEWISMNSSRLRLINGPTPSETVNPPMFNVGERCYARWSNNQRFPATVYKAHQNGKYDVMFDDGLTRTIKWQMMSKITKASHRKTLKSIGNNTPSGMKPNLAMTAVQVPIQLPPPLHNHLFDPKRDHLGTKEERRHLKRRLDVKELFAARKKRKGLEMGLKLTDGRRKKKLKPDEVEEQDNDAKIQKKPDDDIQVLNSESPNVTSPPILNTLNSDIKSPIEVKPSPLIQNQENEIKPVIQPILKMDIVNEISKPEPFPKIPTPSPSILIDADIKQEPDLLICDPKAFNPLVPSYDPKVNREFNSGFMRTSTLQPYSPKHSTPSMTNFNAGRFSQTTPNSIRKDSHSSHKSNAKQVLANSINSSSKARLSGTSLDNLQHLRASEKDWCCRWVNNQPVGTIVDSEPSRDQSVSRITVQVEDVRLPPKWVKFLTRRTIGNTDRKWDVILICPSGRRFRTRGEMIERLREADHDELAPFALALMDFSAHRKQARRRGMDITISEQIKPTHPSMIEASTDLLVASPNLIPPAVAPIGLATPQGENFVYIGSLRVEIIENLLRCPKEGCFKNFRKENLLQMHIKHYHPEMCKFFGDTPNVADLAYARTVVEEPTTPVNRSKEDRSGRPRDRRPIDMHQVKIEFDNSAIKVENLDMDGVNSPSMYDSKNVPINRIFGENDIIAVKNEPWSTETEYGENAWLKQKTPLKPKDQLSRNNLLHISPKFKTHRMYDESDVYNKTQGVYPNHDFVKYQPEVVKRSHKKKIPGAEDRFKNKSIGENTWNMLTPEYDESRSSFEISEKSVINGRQFVDGVKIKSEKDDSNQSMIVTDTGEKIKIVHMKREEIINCHCRFGEEDGLMIQCELCLCWQHALCHNIERESEVPEKYVCFICTHPHRGRKSQKYIHEQDWLYEGKLPRADGPLPSDAAKVTLLRKSHELVANILQLKDLMHSLRCKMEVAEKKDHPKLYLWSKPWEENIADNRVFKDLNGEAVMNSVAEIIKNVDIKIESESIPENKIDDMNVTSNLDQFSIIDPLNNTEITKSDLNIEDVKDVKCDLANGSFFSNILGCNEGATLELPLSKSDLETLAQTVQMAVPEPEAAIEPSECRLRLLQYVERTQNLLNSRLDSIEAQIAELESQNPSLEDDETPEHCPRTKQTIQMLLRDLATLEELGTIC